MNPIPDSERAAWQRTLSKLHPRYDPEAQMLKRPFSSPGYHTTLTGGDVHPTRDSLEYAVALFDSGEPERLAAAEAILSAVIALQDDDPASPTYGVWPWFAEEPLAQMSPPDHNWADFCGVLLLQVWLRHRDRVRAEPATQLRTAIERAATAVRRRDVVPSYTNIALMSTYVALVAGAELARADWLEYGRARLKRFMEHAARHGAFTEYNSPTYTVVALKELAQLRRDVADPEAAADIASLYARAWRHLARRFHAPTGQWSGPHSRAYHTLLDPGTRAFLQAATGGRAKLIEPEQLELPLDWIQLPVRCPDDLAAYLAETPEPRTEVETFWRPAEGEARRSIVGTTHLTPAFSLGSVNHGDGWNQRRSLIAYAGRRGHAHALRLRALHDGYDFCAAQFLIAQSGGQSLVGVGVAPDGGDRHPSLDRIQSGVIRTTEWGLRFELEAETELRLERWPEAWRGEPLHFTMAGVPVQLQVLWAGFGTDPVRYACGLEGKRAWLDLYWYAGEARPLDLTAINPIGALFALRIGAVPAGSSAAAGSTTADGDAPPALTMAGEFARATWRTSVGELKLNLPLRPLSLRDWATHPPAEAD
ncbi:MAG TPA: hypothetical protein VFK80_05020 [Limnochordia bacterium]|nr:hypothetical protein [Limnochordia bacterium]